MFVIFPYFFHLNIVIVRMVLRGRQFSFLELASYPRKTIGEGAMGGIAEGFVSIPFHGEAVGVR